MERKKPTKTQILESIKAIPEVAQVEEYVAFIDHEIELLAKKNSKNSGKVNVDNEDIKALLLEELARIGRPVTVTELMNESPAIQSYRYGKDSQPLTNQKISSILNKIADTNEIVKVTNKKKSYFSLGE